MMPPSRVLWLFFGLVCLVSATTPNEQQPTPSVGNTEWIQPADVTTTVGFGFFLVITIFPYFLFPSPPALHFGLSSLFNSVEPRRPLSLFKK
jgi:hypothetical protein